MQSSRSDKENLNVGQFGMTETDCNHDDVDLGGDLNLRLVQSISSDRSVAENVNVGQSDFSTKGEVDCNQNDEVDR